MENLWNPARLALGLVVVLAIFVPLEGLLALLIHANEGPESTNKNFGGLFPWIDALFGTLLLPRRFPRRYGIDEPMPPGYVGQLAQPFRGRPPDRPAERPAPPG